MSVLYDAKIYRELGWSVIPIQYKGKIPLVAWSKYQEKIATDAEINAWFKHDLPINIGIVTGKISNVIVLDVDKIDALKDKHLPPTICARTGRGGLHYFYRWPGKIARNAAGLEEGLDFRGDGGLVVLPPSVHPNGNQYEWVIHPRDIEISDAPQWLLDSLDKNNHTKDQKISNIPVEAIDSIIPQGKRNAVLASLAGTMRKRGMSQAAIELALLAENNKRCRPPLPNDEVIAIAASISSYRIPDNLNYPLTDAGNAEIIVNTFGNLLRFQHTNKLWYVWNGVYWREDSDAQRYHFAIDAARKRAQFASTIQVDEQKSKIIKWATRSEDDRRLESALKLTAFHKPIRVDVDDCNKDHLLLCCQNGVLDLRTGQLLKGKQSDLITKSSHIVFSAGARCERWLQFLDEIFLGDQELIDFVQRAVGYSLTGETDEQCFFICHGSGSNGKSRFLNIIRLLLGDYGVNTAFDTLTADDMRGSQQTNDLAALCDTRLVTASEVAEGKRLNEARVKSMAGEDKITARFLYKEFFTFLPTFKLWFAVNHRPVIRGGDEGIWRRVRLIPFKAYFAPDAPGTDRNLEEKLVNELPGILNWAIAGCLKWQSSGLGSASIVQAVTSEYREDMDIIGKFLDEETQPSGSVAALDLYNCYTEWCERNGERAITGNLFGRRLTDRGIKRVKIPTQTYIDLSLKNTLIPV